MTSTSSTPSTSNTPTISFFGNTELSTSRSLAASTFLANDEHITIVPSFNLPQPIELISGKVGPFRAGMDVSVPLWLGTMLRRRKLAKIIPPTWLDQDVLKNVLRFERDPNEASFSPDLPFRHAEIANSILKSCRAGSGTGSAAGDASGDNEIPNADQIKVLLEDIQSVRMDKIRRNVHQLSSSTLKTRSKIENIIDVTNIGSNEMHSIKPFVTEAFKMHRELSGKGSSYNQDVEPDNTTSGGGGGSGGRRSGGLASAGRGRLQQSRLVRESENNNAAIQEEEVEDEVDEEELEEPRPLDEMEEEEDVDEPAEDENAGRSNLRRHR